MGGNGIMSYSFRQRLKMALRKSLAEKLGLTQEDKEYILENIMKICPTSDEVAKAMRDFERQKISIDEFIDKLSEADFEDFVKEVPALAADGERK